MLVTSDDQVKAYIKKIMSQLNKWMIGQKISKLVIVFTGKETGDNVERWEFNVQLNKPSKSKTSRSGDKENSAPEYETQLSYSVPPANIHSRGTAPTPGAQDSEALTDEQIQVQIRALFRQITASVTFLPELTEPCTFNVLVYADADSDVPIEWGDSDAKEIDGGEKVQLRSFSTTNHRVDTLVSYKLGD
jgi:mitotic spindle assembly checkpoint protein MAD2